MSEATKATEPAKPTITKTVKFHLHASKDQDNGFCVLTVAYAEACEYVSRYVFDHEFILSALKLQGLLYQTLREKYGLKSQMAISVFKTVVARYKTVGTQLASKPYICWKFLTILRINHSKITIGTFLCCCLFC